MKKIIKVALYNPYLETLGGGEKHILSIIQVFAEMGAEIYIFWDKKLNDEIEDRFSFDFIKNVRWLPNIFKKPNAIEVFKTLKVFDYFFYVTDGSYFASSAKKNFIFAMVPEYRLYDLNLINKLKLWNYKFISNSPFTTSWLNRWGIRPITIPPYINIPLTNDYKKEKIILSVGRFFPHLHSKNHEKIIDTYLLLKKKSKLFSDYSLVLAGGVKKEDEIYFNKLKSSFNDTSILFKSNLSFKELNNLYKTSNYFWHFTGFNIDENISPEKVEHFGIAPFEAMTYEDIVFCYNAGGPKMIVKDNETGFLFNSEAEVISKMTDIESNLKLQKKIKYQAKSYVENNLSYNLFKRRVSELL